MIGVQQAVLKSEVTTVDNVRNRAATCVRRQAGMTLIELMMVVVIVGILASIAFPSWKAYVDRAKRAEAKTLLMDVAARQERYYFDNNAYTTLATDLGYATAQPKSAEGNYELTNPIAVGDTGSINTSYLLTVEPVAPHNDEECGALSLDSKGKQDSETDNTICWSK